MVGFLTLLDEIVMWNLLCLRVRYILDRLASIRVYVCIYTYIMKYEMETSFWF